MPSTKFYARLSSELTSYLYNIIHDYGHQTNVLPKLCTNSDGTPKFMSDKPHFTLSYQGFEKQPIASVKEYTDKYPASKIHIDRLAKYHQKKGVFVTYKGMHVFTTPENYVVVMLFSCPEFEQFQNSLRDSIPELEESMTKEHNSRIDVPGYDNSFYREFVGDRVHLTWFFVKNSTDAYTFASDIERYLEIEHNIFKPRINSQGLREVCQFPIDKINLVSVTDEEFSIN